MSCLFITHNVFLFLSGWRTLSCRCLKSTKSDYVEFEDVETWLLEGDRQRQRHRRLCIDPNGLRPLHAVRANSASFTMLFHSNDVYDGTGFTANYLFHQGLLSFHCIVWSFVHFPGYMRSFAIQDTGLDYPGSLDTALYWSRTLAPNSLALNPDYKIWGHMQEQMCHTPVRDMDDLQQRLSGMWSVVQVSSQYKKLITRWEYLNVTWRISSYLLTYAYPQIATEPEPHEWLDTPTAAYRLFAPTAHPRDHTQINSTVDIWTYLLLVCAT